MMSVSRTRCSAQAVHHRCGTVPNIRVFGGPGSAAQHFMLRCARDTGRYPASVTTELSYWPAPMPLSAKMPWSAIHLRDSSNTSRE